MKIVIDATPEEIRRLFGQEPPQPKTPKEVLKSEPVEANHIESSYIPNKKLSI